MAQIQALGASSLPDIRKRDQAPGATAIDDQLRSKSKDFEAVFIAEMLAHAGFDASRGVAGADAFATFMTRAYSERLVERGGIGLADAIYETLKDSRSADQIGDEVTPR